MTRKDFIMLAQALASAKPHADAGELRMNDWRNICYRVANACMLRGANFDHEKFRKACGMQDNA